MVGGKRIILCIARGGIYGAGSPAASFEHAETYLKAVFDFIGLKPDVIIAEGVAVSPENRRTALDGALASVARLAA